MTWAPCLEGIAVDPGIRTGVATYPHYHTASYHTASPNHLHEEHGMSTYTEHEAVPTEAERSLEALLIRPATTTPSYADARPTGAVPGLRPNPGMLRALMQPVLFLKLLEPVGAFKVGDVVAAQFWGEGRVMLTPLPMAAARGRIPTTFPANQIHAEIAGPVPEHYERVAEGGGPNGVRKVAS
jgi:hypothetical protein